jgi:hypothetical protein
MPTRGPTCTRGCADTAGTPCAGAQTDKRTVPANVSAQDGWSMVLDDPPTRSALQTSQPFPSTHNTRDPRSTNVDGAVGLSCGPTVPAGQEANGIVSVPGTAWYAIFRLDSLLEPWFAKIWRPGEIALVH